MVARQIPSGFLLQQVAFVCGNGVELLANNREYAAQAACKMDDSSHTGEYLD